MAPTLVVLLGDLVAAVPALRRLAAVQLPVKTAYHVAQILKRVSVHVEDFEQQRVAQVKALGVEKDGQHSVDTEGPAWPVFQARMTELLKIEVTVDYRPLDLAHLGGAVISPEDIVALGSLVHMADEPAADTPA